jgi:signal transduction histidine kinase
MIADAESLRSESFEQVGSLIERDVEPILDRWQQCAAAEQPRARRLHHAALRDHLPELLRGLGAALAADAAGPTNGHAHAAETHGRQRWEEGWSLEEVVRDYQILRRVLLEHLDGQLGRPVTLRENLAVGLALDEAIADSVGRFVRHREDAVRRVEQAEADRLREHAAELAAAERHKDEFLAVLGHELRNPLGPVSNAVHMLRQRPDAPTVAWAGDLMARQLRHLTRLVDDLLDTSRLARGKLSLQRERVDLAGLVRTAVGDRRRLFDDGGRQLNLDVPAEPVWVRGDADRLAQVLDNLLGNAHKFTAAGGRVSVRLAVDPAAKLATVTVADTGVGIPAEQLPHVFQRYRQAHADPDRLNGGLGLGLALVKGLVELHGGTVAAASGGPGAGATFAVELPLDLAEPPAALAAGPKPKVLVIEDNRDGADSLAVLLRLFGFDARVAYSGPAGIAAAQVDPPAVVLLDLGMPGMDGYAVAAALRADPATAGACLVAVSGHGGEKARQRSAEAGFARHVLKPVEPEEIRALLTELTKSR